MCGGVGVATGASAGVGVAVGVEVAMGAGAALGVGMAWRVLGGWTMLVLLLAGVAEAAGEAKLVEKTGNKEQRLLTWLELCT